MAVADDGDLVAHLEGLFLVVSDEHRGDLDLAQDALDLAVGLFGVVDDGDEHVRPPRAHGSTTIEPHRCRRSATNFTLA